MRREQIHQRDDVRVQRPPDKFPLGFDCGLLDSQMLGHGVDQREVDHKAVLTAEWP